ncbi:MAG TPA: hypothetical protein VMW56_31625 [Candidatus Margulisiibacteriota bacterium]|nr:hypothetical protein [Candidatus Margulisiibacteriota bacterium]
MTIAALSAMAQGRDSNGSDTIAGGIVLGGIAYLFFLGPVLGTLGLGGVLLYLALSLVPLRCDRCGSWVRKTAGQNVTMQWWFIDGATQRVCRRCNRFLERRWSQKRVE